MLCRDRATERKPVRGKKKEIVTFSCKLLLDSDEHLVRNVAEIVRIQDVLVVPSHILFLVLSLNISTRFSTSMFLLQDTFMDVVVVLLEFMLLLLLLVLVVFQPFTLLTQPIAEPLALPTHSFSHSSPKPSRRRRLSLSLSRRRRRRSIRPRHLGVNTFKRSSQRRSVLLEGPLAGGLLVLVKVAGRVSSAVRVLLLVLELELMLLPAHHRRRPRPRRVRRRIRLRPARRRLSLRRRIQSPRISAMDTLRMLFQPILPLKRPLAFAALKWPIDEVRPPVSGERTRLGEPRGTELAGERLLACVDNGVVPEPAMRGQHRRRRAGQGGGGGGTHLRCQGCLNAFWHTSQMYGL